MLRDLLHRIVKHCGTLLKNSWKADGSLGACRVDRCVLFGWQEVAIQGLLAPLALFYTSRRSDSSG